MKVEKGMQKGNGGTKVSLIIATYNREEDLCKSIECALNQNYENLEIIVVDDSITHSRVTNEYLGRVAGKIIYVPNKKISLPHARNIGILHSEGDIIVFVDDDTIFQRNFVEGHLSYYADPSVGGVAGHYIESHYSEELRGNVFNPLGNRVKYVTGCNMSFRRDVLFEVAGFDERYAVNGLCEEMDLSYRVRKAGYKIVGGEKAFLRHNKNIYGGSRKINQPDLTIWFKSFFRNSFMFSLVKQSILGALIFWFSNRRSLLRYFKYRKFDLKSLRFIYDNIKLGYGEYLKGHKSILKV